MKNFVNLIAIIGILSIATVKGLSLQREKFTDPNSIEKEVEKIPNIGKVQILNGCGIDGAANAIAEYLRENQFDVKYIGNADNWNYDATLVISRSKDTTVASKVTKILNVKNTVLIRNGENLYDVTVIVGRDYKERLANEKTKKKE